MTERKERSFHIQGIPGRALIWKRIPTKRKFSFHLSKLEKSENLLSQENSIASNENSLLTRESSLLTRESSLLCKEKSSLLSKENSILFKENSIWSKENSNMDGKKTSIATNENSKMEKENLMEHLNILSCKRTASIKMATEIDTRTKTSALKDIGNIQRLPGSGALENFDTPMRALPPTMRRLINVFRPSGKKRNISCGSTAFPYKETSNVVDQSLLSIYDFTEADDNMKDILPERVVNNTTSNLGIDAISDDVVIEKQAKDRLVEKEIENSKMANLNDSKNLDLLPIPRASLTCMSAIEEQEIEQQPKDGKCNGKEKIDTGIVRDKSVLLTSFNLPDVSDLESSGDQNDVESLIHPPVTLTEQNAAEEKIVNTPICNNLSQIKRRRMTVHHSNIQPPITTTNGISHICIDAANPQILLLSPVCNTSKNLVTNYSTQSYTHKNLDVSDVYNKTNVPEKNEDSLLQNENELSHPTGTDAANPQIFLLSPVHNTSKNSVSNRSTQSYMHKNLDMSNTCNKTDVLEKDKDIQLIQSEKASSHPMNIDAPNCQIFLSPVHYTSEISVSNHNTQSYMHKNLDMSNTYNKTDVPETNEDLQNEKAISHSTSIDANPQILLLSPVHNTGKNLGSNCNTQNYMHKILDMCNETDENLQLPQSKKASSRTTSMDSPNPQIFLSPVHNTNKNSISYCSTQTNTHKNLDVSNVPEKNGNLQLLQQKGESSDSTTRNIRSKRNSARRRINFQKSTGIVVHQSEALFQERTNGNNPIIEPQKGYYLPQELVQKLKKRTLKQNLNFEILSNDKPDLVLVPKKKKKYVKKPQKPLVGRLPNKVKVLMYNKALFKRKMTDVTDLEIIFNILNSKYSEGAENTRAGKIFKNYQKHVIRDVADLIYDSVELQTKAKEIKKLYREIERKGKQLGTLIDERNKIHHGIANGELCFVD